MHDQHDVIAFLSQPSSYGQAPDVPVEVVETHGSRVFLVAERAFKLKRAVAYADLDFLTLAHRAEACRAELRLNRRTAPSLYLGLLAIRRGQDGRLQFDGAGETLDWVVAMRRFPQTALFERMARDGRLDPPLARRLGQRIARFHATAERMPTLGGAAAIRRLIADNDRELRRHADRLDRQQLDRLRQLAEAEAARLAATLEARRVAGLVRRGHGDLRLANICLFENEPTLFDGIEFSERLNCIDVLLDLAFVLMDLDHHRLPALSRGVLDGYRETLPEPLDERPLPLFLALRAATRCFTLAGSAERQCDPTLAALKAAESCALLEQALAYLQDGVPPSLSSIT